MKRNIRTIAVIVFFSSFVLYGIFETAKVFLGPSIVVTSPKNLETVKSHLITVEGQVKRAAYITINDRQIFSDTAGHFSDKLILSPGYNIIKLNVKDRFDKEVSKNIEVWFKE